MRSLKEKIKIHVKEKIRAQLLDSIELLRFEMRKRFTLAWLFFLGILLIFQGIVRLLPHLVNVPEYFSFFVIGGILLFVAFVYSFSNRHPNEAVGQK